MKSKIGHYDIVTELGRGGMGVVYKGHEAQLHRYVAIKVLSPALAHDESVKERFLREARSMAALNDPHIIQVYFIGEDDGQPYFAMEFVEGESLSSYLKRETKMTPREAARVVYQTAQGLATAHDKGVVHRDIKPGNLMLDQKGRIKIADFGIAFQNDLSKKLTSTGEFVGTPGYLSPEVCTGQRVDQRSDIFSLGIVLFELLTGRMPFTDESPLGLLLEVVRAEIPDVRLLNAEVDAELTAILAKMTAKDPANRYSSCHELAADLAAHPHVAGQQTITAKPMLSPAAATVVGMKTPPEAMIAAQRAATPPPVAAAAVPIAAAPAAAAQPPRASVLSREERRGHSAAWAIAAMLLLLVGAGAWAMRGHLPMFAKPDATSVASRDASVSASSPASASSSVAIVPPAPPAAPAPPVGPSEGEGSTSPRAGVAAEGRPAGADGTIATSVIPAPNDPASGAEPRSDASSGAGADNEPGEPRSAFVASETSAETASSDARTGRRGDAPPALAALRRAADERRAATQDERAAARDERTVARTTPPAPAAPRRPSGPPRIAVVSVGDPAITGPAEQMVEDAIADAGLLLADEEMVSGVGPALRSGDADLPQLFRALARDQNVRAVIVVRGEPLGSTPLTYYGQVDTLYSVALTVRGYDVESRSPLGAGLRAKVDFTNLNAETKAQEALEPQLRRITGSLARYRARGAGG